MNLITIDKGEYRISANPDDALAAYQVDQGFVVTLHDPQQRVGGLLRFSEPDSRADPFHSARFPAVYADTGLAALVAEACAQGASKTRAVIQIVGGAHAGSAPSTKKSYLAARKNLWKLGLCIHKECVGGENARNVRLEIASGVCRVAGAPDLAFEPEGGALAGEVDCVMP